MIKHLLAIGLLIGMTASAAALECKASAPSNSSDQWSYRLIEGRQCWYQGRGMEKAQLRWGEEIKVAHRAPVAKRDLWERFREVATETAKEQASPAMTALDWKQEAEATVSHLDTFVEAYARIIDTPAMPPARRKPIPELRAMPPVHTASISAVPPAFGGWFASLGALTLVAFFGALKWQDRRRWEAAMLDTKAYLKIT